VPHLQDQRLRLPQDHRGTARYGSTSRPAPNAIERHSHKRRPSSTCSTSKKKGKAGEAEIEAVVNCGLAILKAVKTIKPNVTWRNRASFSKYG